MANSSLPIVWIAIGLVRWKDQFLVGQRAPGQSLAGFAEFPGGKVEPGETVEQAVQREIMEETGLTVKLLPWKRFIEHTAATKELMLTFQLCEPVGEQQPHPPFRWVQRDEAVRMKFPSANALVLADLAARVDERI